MTLVGKSAMSERREAVIIPARTAMHVLIAFVMIVGMVLAFLSGGRFSVRPDGMSLGPGAGPAHSSRPNVASDT